MKINDILQLRLDSQQIVGTMFREPAEIVSWMLAMQAQDYAGAKWSIALRLPDCRERDVDHAIATRKIVRTWPMRGTLHFLAAADVRWMLRLLAPRVIAKAAGRYRQLELTNDIFAKSLDILYQEMEGGKLLTRGQVYQALETNGIATEGQRGIHIIGHLSQTCKLCHGPYHDKQPTYVLMDDWLPANQDIEGEEALSTLAFRYFASHGPATIQDFIWWTGLTVKEARTALQLVTGKLEKLVVGEHTFWMGGQSQASPRNTVQLLPGFDEYMLGYTNRSLMVPDPHLPKIVPGNNGMFMPTIVVNGRVAGTWKRTLKKDQVHIEPLFFEKPGVTKRKMLATAARAYGRYLEKEPVLSEI